MAKKKKDDLSDAAAGFFGDGDIDWLADEEDDEDAAARAAAGAAPAAPLPPPPAAKEEAAPDEAKDEGDGKALKGAPTMTFSAIPSLPPAEPDPVPPKPSDAPADGDVNTEDAPTIEAPRPDDPAGEDGPDGDVSDAEEEPRAEEGPAAVRISSDWTESEEVFGDQLEGQGVETPLIRTHEPAPTRGAAGPPGGAASLPSFTPPAGTPRPAHRRDRSGGWGEVADALVAEAAVSSDGRGQWLFEAGRTRERRLDDWSGAERLYREAASSGFRSADLNRALADLAIADGRVEDSIALLVAAAEMQLGSTRADTLVRAGRLAVRIAATDEALGHAMTALEAEPNNFDALSLAREVLGEGEDRVDILGRLAALGEGPLAAEAFCAQAEALRQLGRGEESARAYEEAIAADPDSVAAFVGLERLLLDIGDDRALATVYLREAARTGCAAPGWWHLAAARALSRAEDPEADAAFATAIGAGFSLAEPERVAALEGVGRYDELAASLAENAGDDPAVWFEVAWIREHHLDDAEGSLEAIDKALGADPASDPARRARTILLEKLGRTEALDAQREQQLRDAAAPEARLRLADMMERHGDLAQARALLEAIFAEAPQASALVACAERALGRVLLLEGDAVAVRALFVRLAEAATEPPRQASLWLRASMGSWTVPTDGAGTVIDDLKRALEIQPGHPEALMGLDAVGAANQQWDVAAAALDAAAAAAEDAREELPLRWRAAMIRLHHIGDVDAGRAALERCLEIDPGFGPATGAIAQLPAATGAEERATALLALADEAADAATASGYRFAAAVMTTGPASRALLERVLADDPAHDAARALWQRRCLVDGDTAGLATLVEAALGEASDAERPWLKVRLAELKLKLDRRDDAARLLAELAELDAAPILQAAARVAERAGAYTEAVTLLENVTGVDDVVRRAELLIEMLGSPGPALVSLKGLLLQSSGGLKVALAAALAARRADDLDSLSTALAWIGKTVESAPARAAFASWAAAAHARQQREDQALDMTLDALAARPGSLESFRSAVAGLAGIGDVERIESLFTIHRPTERLELARAIEAADEPDRAIEILEAHVPDADPKLPVLLELEQMLADGGHWRRVFEVITARREATTAGDQRALADAKRRWLLAEKLADTDQAWELYRRLHEDDPDDREVTEALARIAGARQETALAIGYLKELAESAEDPSESARYQRRIGAVHEASEDTASARQAYIDALDHVPDDAEALGSLRRLAENEEDWPGLIAVLHREVDIANPERRLSLKREIAELTERSLGDPAVAIDAWRAVLEEDSANQDALRHVMHLAEQQAEWGTFVETGTVLAETLEGAERSAMLGRVGVACEEHLDRTDAIRLFEKAVVGATPDLESARRLEALYRDRSDWTGVLRALTVLADASGAAEETVGALERAARVETEVRHDREAAAAWYARILLLDADHNRALRFMATHLYDTQRFDEALPVCARLEPAVETAADLDDFDVRMEISSFYFSYGEMLNNSGSASEALKRYERALELNPTHLATLQSIGPLYTQAEQWKKAERVYRQLLQLSGGQGDKDRVASTYTQLGLVERQLGNEAKAYRRFNKALEIHPDHVGALQGMALILQDREDWSGLLNIFNNIIYHATIPQDVIDAYMTKGRVLDEHMERPDKAAQHYQRSLDFDPDQPLAYLRLCELAMRREAYNEAGELARQGLELAARLGRAAVENVEPLLLVFAAAASKYAGDPEQAGGQLARATEQAPELADLLPDDPLEDIQALREVVRAHMP